MRRSQQEFFIRVVLCLTGLVALFTGANIGFGGIATLGFDGPRDFFQITDPAAFAMHDSHVRYVGGLWLGMGILFIAGAIWIDRLREAVMAGLALMFVGGLSRLSSGDLTVFASPLVGPSFAFEILAVPVLIWRLWAGRSE